MSETTWPEQRGPRHHVVCLERRGQFTEFKFLDLAGQGFWKFQKNHLFWGI